MQRDFIYLPLHGQDTFYTTALLLKVVSFTSKTGEPTQFEKELFFFLPFLSRFGHDVVGPWQRVSYIVLGLHICDWENLPPFCNLHQTFVYVKASRSPPEKAVHDSSVVHPQINRALNWDQTFQPPLHGSLTCSASLLLPRGHTTLMRHWTSLWRSADSTSAQRCTVLLL